MTDLYEPDSDDNDSDEELDDCDISKPILRPCSVRAFAKEREFEPEPGSDTE